LTLIFYFLFIKTFIVMKKLMILLAVACLIFVSCGTKTEIVTEPVEETTCPFALGLEKWATLNDEGVDQEALVAEMKALFDDCCKEKCTAEEGEAVAEPCPEKEAFKAKWDAFDTLTLEEKIELLNQAIEHTKKCCEKKAEVEAEVTE
jgi:hypothetical protein